MQGIAISVSYAGNDREVVVVTVNGYVDTTTAPELREAITEQVARRKYRIVVDLHGVDYISSTGWGVFVGELKDLRENKGDLVLAGMVTNVHNIYELMEFSSIIKSFFDAEQATAHFLGKPANPAPSRPAQLKQGPMQPQPAAPKQASVPPASSKPVPFRLLQTAAPKQAPSRPVPPKQGPSPSQPAGVVTSKNEVLNGTGYALGKAILRVIAEKPYLGVREIAKALELPQYGGHKNRVQDVKRELKQMGLLGQRERYEFAIQSRPEGSQ
jgi:anti-sigma B factor antagonist